MKFVVRSIVLFVMSFSLFAETQPLFPGQVFLAGEKPVSMVTSDFNGDGYIDMAVANNISNDVSVLLNDRAGGFLAAIQYDVGEGPQEIYCADFDGDNRADLAVTNTETGISFLMGNDSGGFLEAVNYVPGNSTIISSADVDNNGYFESDYVRSVGICNGDGGFSTGELLFTSDVIADFNGDGNVDVVLGRLGSTIEIAFGDGTGTFSDAIEYATTLSELFELIAVDDFNGDGYDDLAATDPYGQLVILISNSLGGFLAVESPLVETDAVLFSVITTSDINNDGNMDMIASPFMGSDIKVLLGIGDGSFLAPTVYGSGFSSEVKTVVDIDSDGVLDLIYFVGLRGGIGVLLGDGRGGFYSSTNYTTETERADNATSGDFNGDGYADIATATARTSSGIHVNSISVLLGNGDGRFSSPVNYYDEELKPTAIESGDFNNDGNDDVVVFSAINVGGVYVESISVLLSNGVGGFSSSQKYLENSSSSIITTNDFNGDGFIDIAVFDRYLDPLLGQNLNILLNNGSGGFVVIENSFGTISSAVHSVTSADFNDDGHADIAGTHTVFGGTKVFLGDGSGGFVLEKVYTSETGNLITHEDFNRDGYVDLAITGLPSEENEYEDAAVKILLGDGAGNFAIAFRHDVVDLNILNSSISSADFTGDGYMDVVMTDTLGGFILLISDGSGGFYAEPKRFAGGSLSVPLLVADFDGNGRPDLAISGFSMVGLSTKGIVTVLLNRSNSPIPVGSINIDDGKSATNSNAVVLSLSCADDVECTQMQFSNDNLAWGLPVANSSSANWMLAEGNDGLRTVYARFMDGDGNMSPVVNDEIRIDTVAPAAPVIITPTNETTESLSRPTISGTAENGATIVVRDGATILGRATAINNSWSVEGSGFFLVEGVHRFTATAIDQAGNISPTSEAVIYTVSASDASDPVDTSDGSTVGGSGGGGGIGYFILFTLISIFGYRSTCSLKLSKS